MLANVLRLAAAPLGEAHTPCQQLVRQARPVPLAASGAHVPGYGNAVAMPHSDLVYVAGAADSQPDVRGDSVAMQTSMTMRTLQASTA